MSDEPKVDGLTLTQWAAAFRPGMPEFAASNYVFSREAAEQVRIAFCNQGPATTTQGNRAPVFTHAVTLPPAIAVELARQLLEHYATPKDDLSRPVAAV